MDAVDVIRKVRKVLSEAQDTNLISVEAHNCLFNEIVDIEDEHAKDQLTPEKLENGVVIDKMAITSVESSGLVTWELMGSVSPAGLNELIQRLGKAADDYELTIKKMKKPLGSLAPEEEEQDQDPRSIICCKCKEWYIPEEPTNKNTCPNCEEEEEGIPEPREDKWERHDYGKGA